MKKKIIGAALAVLLLAGCGDTSESQGETSVIVSEPASETIPESSADTESAASDIDETSSETTPEPDTEVNEMKITVNGAEFSAKFHDTKAAEEFKAMLPLTLDMSELNGNEKFFYLEEHLSAKSEKVGHINSGDIMLYGSNCVVLFYDSFSTPYSYTRIGYIEDPDGLKKAVGSGDVTVEYLI